jgi:hypothetical protein
MSRITTLMYGEAEDVAAALEDEPAEEFELRMALQNAFRRIDTLEKALENKVDKEWRL